MSEIADYVVQLLHADMVSHGFLLQSVHQKHDRGLDWRVVLRELLSGDVEIGEANLASRDYVEFVAWKGTVDDRIARAEALVNLLMPPDREFAYWLALRMNVDRFEGDGSAMPPDTHKR